jgi:hypothetical protein
VACQCTPAVMVTVAKVHGMAFSSPRPPVATAHTRPLQWH